MKNKEKNFYKKNKKRCKIQKKSIIFARNQKKQNIMIYLVIQNLGKHNKRTYLTESEDDARELSQILERINTGERTTIIKTEFGVNIERIITEERIKMNAKKK